MYIPGIHVCIVLVVRPRKQWMYCYIISVYMFVINVNDCRLQFNTKVTHSLSNITRVVKLVITGMLRTFML